MQRKLSVVSPSPPTQPPKPADKPGGSWVLTSSNMGGCYTPRGPNGGPSIMVCIPDPDVYEWRFVKNGEALNVGRGGRLIW